MHDIVRDVAIFIASSKDRQLIRCGDNCTWVSLFVEERIELSKGSTFPNLRLLLIVESAKKEFQIDDDYFGGMINLNVLSIKYDSIRSLPHTTQVLKNLRTLILDSCSSLEIICIVGELENLETLICHYCYSIKELPVEMGRLRRLKLLEISNCRRLQKIASGVISKLDKLEELKVVGSFRKWEAGDNNNEGKGRKNAGLRELRSLTRLTCLEIEIEDSALAAQPIRLSGKLEKFYIKFGVGRYYSGNFDKKLALDLPGEISLGHWINKQLLRKTECLVSVGVGSNNLDLAKAENIRSLTLEDCPKMKKLVNFPRLESLRLFNIPNLEELWDINGQTGSPTFKELRLTSLPALEHLWKHPRQNVISNISSIDIYNCRRLHNLFSLATAEDCLIQLESLEISDCEMMEQVLLWSIEEENQNEMVESDLRRRRVTFPKLKTVRLKGLPNLTTFCKGIESIEFPALNEMQIEKCPQLKSLVVSTTSSSGSGNDENNSEGFNHDDDSLHWLCHSEKVAYGSLVKFRIYKIHAFRFWCHRPIDFAELKLSQCSKIRSLFSYSIAAELVNLKILGIHDCGEMVTVIEDDKEKDACQSTSSLFPNLKFLYLSKLWELKRVCELRCALELPSLECVGIEGCPKMERFTMGSLSTPSLKKIQIQETGPGEFFELEIMSCEMMEEVLFLSHDIGQTHRGGHIAALPKLEELKLCNMPNLTTFCKLAIFERIEFPMLKEMRIEKCPKLKTLVSTTWSSSGGRINHCDDDDSLHLFCEPKVDFGGLKKLYIAGYINTLKLWCRQIPNHFFMGLERLSISHCGKIRSLFSSSIAKNLHNLIYLSIDECGEMVKVIEDEEQEKDGAWGGQSQTTIRHFPGLEELCLKSLSKLEIFCEWRSSRTLVLPSLEKVEIDNCPKMERFNLGSLTTPNLKVFDIYNIGMININAFNDVLQVQNLRITSCEMMEQVVPLLNEEQNEKMHIGHSRRCSHIEFPLLETLVLDNLPRLTTFGKGIERIEFPMLTKIEIGGCPNMKNLVSTTTSSSGGIYHGDDGDSDDSLHFFCEPKVAFGKLKELAISKYESHALILWSRTIPDDFLTRLVRVSIRDCSNIRSLFSSSIAANLVNLKNLEISGCHEMVEVIEDDEKEKDAACGGQTTIHLFPMLESLCLWSLPKLEIFCKWTSSRALVLPSLEDVKINYCPKMERFSLGSLTTPCLIWINMDYEKEFKSDDLNVLLQHHFFSAKEEEEKKKKKREEEEKMEKEKREEEEREQKEENQKRIGEITEEEDTDFSSTV